MKARIGLRKWLHLGLLADLIAGTLFAWYNSVKDLGLFGSSGTSCSIGSSSMIGLPICVWGAMFFTLALVLAVAIWYVKE